jgi:hypothetical protein
VHNQRLSSYSTLLLTNNTAPNIMASSSRPVLVVLASTSLIICTGGLMRWRARHRAKKVAEKARQMCTSGPMVSLHA